ncbi:hypothetical protein RB597_007138 [Gaeumannomyces tritici]
MASILRQIVAGPRARHEETGLDLCYVTSNIIATSGPSQTYPQRAYRNPLDRLVAFLDDQHGDDWAIWEFRGEGTGYPDDAVYGRIRHYPWPDHHPPPFRIVPLIIASMRNWLAGGDLGGAGAHSAADEDGQVGNGVDATVQPDLKSLGDRLASRGVEGVQDKAKAERLESAEHTSQNVEAGTKKGRVVVVHCKAGKGRSGSMACSFLISERGWTPEDALARFTERRMRPKFGAGVTIPSQLRWISYVDRWANQGGKRYTDRAVEILEVHMWGLRSGVKVSVEHFVDEGRKIKVLHTFTRDERVIVEGDTPSAGTVAEVVPDLTKLAAAEAHSGAGEDADYEAVKDAPGKNDGVDAFLIKPNKSSKAASLMRKLSKRATKSPHRVKAEQGDAASVSSSAAASSQLLSSATTPATTPATASASQSSLSKASVSSETEPGGMAVIFKPKQPLIVPNSDINIAVERRNKAPASMGLMTMVTAVAHVWFNVFFEGRGPEQGGKADNSGVFEIEWDKLDGIKGSSQKGTRGLDRLAVVWRTVESAQEDEPKGTSPAQSRPLESNQGGAAIHLTRASTEIREPGEGDEVPQMVAADWKGANKEDPDAEKRLGLRVQDPNSANVSRASSIKSLKIDRGDGKSAPGPVDSGKDKDGDTDSFVGVKTSGPEGEPLDESTVPLAPSTLTGRKPEAGGTGVEPSIADATSKKGFIVE